MVEGRFRYPAARLLGDYARAGLGLAPTGLALAAFQPGPWMTAALGGAALVFALFGLRTVQRHLTTVEVDARGIRARGPLGGTVTWDRLDRVRLRYYATRRDRRDGWMQMTLRGPGRVTIESALDGFDLIAGRVAAEMRARRLPAPETTLRNFAALGLDADPRAGAEPAVTAPADGASPRR